MKKILVLFLSAMMLCAVSACAPAVNGSFDEVDAAALPSKVDLRDFDGKSFVTSVKSQRFGDCWAFSLAGSAEVAYLYANDLGVPAGEVNDQVNFSEKYVAWYMFHGITKDDVIKGKVRASQVGEGFDPSIAEKKFDNIIYGIGGPNIHSAALFMSGFGPVDESVEVRGERPYAYDDESSVEWHLPLTDEYRNAPVTGSLRAAYDLTSPASKDADGNYVLDEKALAVIKSELTKGHGVSFGFCSSGGYNNDNKAAYHSGKSPADHAITVIGYDDDYPKENFTRRVSTGEEVKGTTPPDDGAFIIKNSWGIIDSEEDGYFYLSYYDHSIVNPLSFAFDNTASLNHTALNYDQYDLMMTQWYATADYDAETRMANVFDAEEDESLFQIAYRTASEKTEVTYEIYKDVGNDPASGTLLETGVSRHLLPGYHKIDLRGEYDLKKGDRYAVVLTMQRVTDEDGNTVYTDVLPYSTEFFDGMTVHGLLNKGESFLYADGKWRDLSVMRSALVERAYNQCVEDYGARKNELRINMDSKDTFTIDNYPIKAILAPVGE